MEKSILSYDQSATFDSTSRSLSFQKYLDMPKNKWAILILRALGGEIGNSSARSSVSEY